MRASIEYDHISHISWGEIGFSQHPESGWNWSRELDAPSLSARSKDLSGSWISLKALRLIPRLTADHHLCCCMLAHKHQNWKHQHWSPVVFTDEFLVSLYNCNGHARVFLRVVERLVDCYIQVTDGTCSHDDQSGRGCLELIIEYRVTFLNVVVRPGHRTVLCVATCCAGRCPGPTISIIFASVFKTGQYWHSCAWVQLADWAQPHLHQCKSVNLPVLFLLFTGCVSPASCRLLFYRDQCWLVFGWQAAQPGRCRQPSDSYRWLEFIIYDFV